MINAKRLLQMVKKWQNVAAAGRRRITSTRSDEKCITSVVARKGHVFVYSSDGKRFMIPLEYLSSNIFRELFRMSEEEYGFKSDGPIVLPCDTSCMEYIVSLLPFQVSKDVEKAVLTSIARSRCTMSSLPLIGCEQQKLILCSF